MFFVFRPKNKDLSQHISITFRGATIKQVTSHRFPGVTLNKNFSWSPYINRIRTDVSRFTGVVYKLKHLLPAWLKKDYALIPSRLSYCSLVYGEKLAKSI